MLVTLKDILAKAEEGKYAVGLFNMLNLEMARGIIEAAEEEKSPGHSRRCRGSSADHSLHLCQGYYDKTCARSKRSRVFAF